MIQSPTEMNAGLLGDDEAMLTAALAYLAKYK
jgi:hypothetical protein